VFRVTFLGHQGWLFESGATSLLVDPLLTDTIGHAGTLVSVFPPRTFHFERFPRISAVLLSHEHEDHFDIPSLNRLDRSIPILLSSLSSAAARAILKEMGFTVTLVSAGETHRIGSLDLHLFGPDHVTHSEGDEWDLVQYLVADSKGAGSFFTGVDAAVAPATWQRLSEIVEAPGLICHTNNHTNWEFLQAGKLLDPGPPFDTVRHAAQIAEVEAQVRWSWGIPAGTLFCGGGFSFYGSREWMNQNVFESDSNRISQALSVLIPDRLFLVPSPGQTVSMTDGEVTAISKAEPFLAAHPESDWPSREFLKNVKFMNDYDPVSGRVELTEPDLLELQGYLTELAGYLYGRDEFKKLFSFHERDVEGRRPALALVLLADEERNSYTFVWDPQGCGFRPVESENPVAEYAGGMELWGSDLLALFRSELSPWAISNGGSRVWNFVPDRLTVNVFRIWEFFHPLRRPKEYLSLYRKLFAQRDQEPPLVRGIQNT
jgi:hypothetical protein